MKQDLVALALIEARLAAAREQQLVTQIRRARREARRAHRLSGSGRWWTLRRGTGPATISKPRLPDRVARTPRPERIGA